MNERVATVLAGDARAGRRRTRPLQTGEAERVPALEDAAEEQGQQASGNAVRVAAGAAPAPPDDGADDEVTRGLVPVRGDAADDRRVLGVAARVEVAVEQ